MGPDTAGFLLPPMTSLGLHRFRPYHGVANTSRCRGRGRAHFSSGPRGDYGFGDFDQKTLGRGQDIGADASFHKLVFNTGRDRHCSELERDGHEHFDTSGDDCERCHDLRVVCGLAIGSSNDGVCAKTSWLHSEDYFVHQYRRDIWYVVRTASQTIKTLKKILNDDVVVLKLCILMCLVSVTLDGIRYVVDCGKHKTRDYNGTTGMESLMVQDISQAQAAQRTGRAGRISAGVCFRLYTEDAFASLAEVTTPEILRVNLAQVVLMLKGMGVHNPADFDYLTPPSKQSLKKACELLYALEALDDQLELTEYGKKMAKLPVDPIYAHLL